MARVLGRVERGAWPATPTVVLIVLTICSAATLGAAVAFEHRFLLVAIALVLLSLLFQLPMRFFPAMIVWSFALLPVGYMDVGLTFSRYVTPAVIILAIFVLRTLMRRKRQGGSRIHLSLSFTVLPILIGIGVVASMIGSVSPRLSFAWSFTAIVCVAGAFVVARRGGMSYWPSFVRNFLWLGVFLGSLSVLDYVFGLNPWNELLRDAVSDKSWTVFRSRTSLGHPLLTSLVASMVLMVGFFEIVKSKGFRKLALVGAIGAAVAIAASVSRTGVISVMAGLTVGLVAISVQLGAVGFSKIFAIGFTGVGAMVALINSPLFVERNASSGGVASSEYRDTVFAKAVSMIQEQHIFGSGPGTSSRVFAQQFGLVFENSWLQILVSTGVLVGTAIIVVVVALIVKGLKYAPPAALAALTSFVMSVAGFSALDNNPACLVIVFPVLMCVSASLPESSSKRDVQRDPLDASFATL